MATKASHYFQRNLPDVLNTYSLRDVGRIVPCERCILELITNLHVSVQNTCLRSNDKLIFRRIFDPFVVVLIVLLRSFAIKRYDQIFCRKIFGCGVSRH